MRVCCNHQSEPTHTCYRRLTRPVSVEPTGRRPTPIVRTNTYAHSLPPTDTPCYHHAVQRQHKLRRKHPHRYHALLGWAVHPPPSKHCRFCLDFAAAACACTNTHNSPGSHADGPTADTAGRSHRTPKTTPQTPTAYAVWMHPHMWHSPQLHLPLLPTVLLLCHQGRQCCPNKVLTTKSHRHGRRYLS